MRWLVIKLTRHVDLPFMATWIFPCPWWWRCPNQGHDSQYRYRQIGASCSIARSFRCWEVSAYKFWRPPVSFNQVTISFNKFAIWSLKAVFALLCTEVVITDPWIVSGVCSPFSKNVALSARWPSPRRRWFEVCDFAAANQIASSRISGLESAA